MKLNAKGGGSPVRLISWNVNGIRAVLKKGLLEFIAGQNPDILCLQETRARPEQVADVPWPEGYRQFWNPALKPGYAGTATFTKIEPLDVIRGIGIPEHDNEGRVLTLEFSDWYVVNCYTPNAQRELTRLDYRQQWDRDFLTFLKNLEKKKPVVFGGDMNVAHTEIDLARPKENVRNHGFTIEERTGFENILQAGFIDTFREFEKEGGHYTWWMAFGNARARNIGWRIDYWVISAPLRPRLKRAWILSDVYGSDHCPVGIELISSL
jgi:exodeoxyribonuclease III